MVQNLLRVGQSLSNDLQQLYQFFALLDDCLGLKRAVLLLRDPQKRELRPWCQIGLDQTSLLGLRLQESQLDFLPGNGNFLFTKRDRLPGLSFFSSKDAQSVDELLLVPILEKKSWAGLLIIADNPYFDLGDEAREMVFRPLQDLLRKVILQHRRLTAYAASLPVALLDPAAPSGKERAERTVLTVRAKELAELLCADYPCNLVTAVVIDVRGRLVRLLEQQIEQVLVSPGCCHLVFKPEAKDHAEDLIDLALSSFIASSGLSIAKDKALAHCRLQSLASLWKS